MRRLSYWGSLGILGLVLAGGAYVLHEQGADTASAHPSASAAAAPMEKLVTVEAVPVAIDTVLDTIRAVASLQPNESVVIAPEIAGRIVRLPFAEGDLVEAGDVLVELDAEMLKAELAKARSDLTLAKANRDRLETLAKLGTDSLRARDEAVAAYRAAEANAALAELRLQKSAITAPFAGAVGVRAVSVGAYVTPGQRIVELVDIDPIKVDFRVPELALRSLRVGQPVRVTVDALPGETFDGEVYVIDPVIDVNGRAVRLRAYVPNPERRLSPGLFARVEIVVERRNNAVLIPESAVFAQGQSRFAYRVVDGRAVQTPLELGQRRPGAVEVRRGLERDAVVITAGHQQLRDGDRVRVAGASADG